ncbi:hypothetical protein D3C85_1407910 [compost metagenome]
MTRNSVATSCRWMFLRAMLLITPPRVWPDLKKMPSGTGYSILRPDTSMSSNPPEVSLPKVIPACASRTMQSRTFT